jgi:hypothetical protein
MEYLLNRLVPSLNRLRQRYSSFYSEEIFFDGQLSGSVRILPADKIKNFLDVVNYYDVDNS